MLIGGSSGGSAQCVVNGDLAMAYGLASQALAAQGGTLLLQSPPQSARFSFMRRGLMQTGLMKVNFNADLSVMPAGPRQTQVRVDCRPDSLNSLITVSIGGTLLMAMLGGAQGFLVLLLFGAAATAWMVYSLSKNVPKEIADQAILAVQMAAQGNVTGPMAQPRPPQPPPPPPSPQPPPPPPPPPAPAPAEAQDISVVMRKLVELRDMGAVTPEEFEAKKAELLKRL